MAKKSWTLRALMALASLSTARSLCDDVMEYLNVPVPLGGDTTIELDLRRVDCPQLEDRELDEIIVRGGTLTLSSATTVRFVNLRFTVEDGASLIFDMPKTQFGPNSGTFDENPGGFLIDVKEGGSVEFTGKFGGRKVINVRSMFYNAGTMEFNGDALFQDNGHVFRSNSGTLKFRGDTIFRDNNYLPIDNIDAGYIRFSKTVLFDRNGDGFDGGNGCAIGNHDSKGTVIFRGDAVFSNHVCDLAGAVYNAGKMRFYGKAYFNDNLSYNNGGAVDNSIGSLIFKAAVQFNRNQADNFGGALSVQGGEVMFEKGVLFSGNDAFGSGAAFSVTFGENYENGEVTAYGYGTLTFNKPSATRFEDNSIISTVIDQTIPACTIGYVVGESTLEGYLDDDVCVERLV